MRIEFESRSQQALTLQELGYTYGEISKMMGIRSSPGSYLRYAATKGITAKKLTEKELAVLTEKWGEPVGIEKPPVMDFDEPERPKKEAKKQKTEKLEKKVVVTEAPVVEEPEDLPPDEEEPDILPETESAFSLGQKIKVSGVWKGRKFTKTAQVMGFLQPGQDLTELFEKPPAKKNIYRIGALTESRLAVVSETGKIKSYFDPTEDQVKTID